MHIAIGSDHGGYGLKQTITEFLNTEGHQVLDLGVHSPE